MSEPYLGSGVPDIPSWYPGRVAKTSSLIAIPDELFARLEKRAAADGLSPGALLEKILAPTLREIENRRLPLIVCSGCRQPQRHRPIEVVEGIKGHVHIYGCTVCGQKRRYGYTGDGESFDEDSEE